MSDRLPGSSYDNPLWHRRWRIWSTTDDRDRHVFAYASEDADLDDTLDPRHGEANSLHQARADIDEYLICQEFIVEQRRKTPERDTDLEAAGRGGFK